MNLLQRLFKGDKTVWLIFAVLCVISLIEVYSAIGTLAYASKSGPFAPIIRHALFLLVGAAIVVCCHNFHYKYTGLLVFPLLFLSVLMLILTLSFGVSANEAKRWIEIFGVQLQPSELSKLSIVLFTAWRFGKAKTPEAKVKAFWWVLGVTGVTAMLIVTENLSTAVLLCLFVYFMMFIAGAPKKQMLILTGAVVSVAVIVLLLLYNVDEIKGLDRWSTWHNRLVEEKIDVKDPAYQLNDDNRQVHYAKIAISEGKYLGVFPGNSSQRDFLPQAYSDFIYAIIIEDMGWFGMFLVPFLYIFLLFRAWKISKKCTRSVPMLLMMGSALIVSMQAFVNMAVAVGFLPVTGQPLPLISRGGTSGIITCLYFALILSVSRFGATEDEASVLEAEAAEDDAAEQAARAAKEAEDALRKEMMPETYMESEE